MTQIKLLDCTIRDGGYVNDWKFTDEQLRECYIACSNSGVEYMEIGFRNFKKPDLLNKYGKSFFCEEKYLNEILMNLGEKRFMEWIEKSAERGVFEHNKAYFK